MNRREMLRGLLLAPLATIPLASVARNLSVGKTGSELLTSNEVRNYGYRQFWIHDELEVMGIPGIQQIEVLRQDGTLVRIPVFGPEFKARLHK